MKLELIGYKEQLQDLYNIIDLMNGKVLHSLCLNGIYSIIAEVYDKYLPTVINLHTDVTTIANEQVYTINLKDKHV